MESMFEEAQLQLQTLRDVLRFAVSRFVEAELSFGHGTSNPWDEAAYLALHVLHLPHELVDACLDARLLPAERGEVLSLIERRIRERLPAPYLTHEAWLAGYRFYVDQRVIVPRSHIAELVEEQFSPWLVDAASVRHVLDLCTGSGCLAVLLALNFSYASVDAVDLSADALAVAQRNVGDYGLNDQVHLFRSDLFEQLPQRQYDWIISNPPYVNALSMQTLPEEYLHEPRMALEAGDDGLDVVRRILAEAPRWLGEDGLLVVEIGHNRMDLEAAFPNLPFTWLQTHGSDEHVFLLTRQQLVGVDAVPVSEQ